MVNRLCLPHSSKGSATSVASKGTRAKTAEAAGPELKSTAEAEVAEVVPEVKHRAIVEDSKLVENSRQENSKALATTVESLAIARTSVTNCMAREATRAEDTRAEEEATTTTAMALTLLSKARSV